MVDTSQITHNSPLFYILCVTFSLTSSHLNVFLANPKPQTKK